MSFVTHDILRTSLTTLSEKKIGTKRPRDDDDKGGKKKKGFLYETKCLMNKLIDTTKNVDRSAVISEIQEKIKGSEMTTYSFGIHPTGSRVLQAMLKHGNAEHRRAIREKYQEHLTELVQTKGGILLAEKIFRYSLKITTNKELTDEEKETQKKIFSTLVEPFLVRKTINRLLFHKLGCRFLNFLFFFEHTKKSMQHQIVNTIALPKKISFLVDGMKLASPISENLQALNDEQKKQVALHLADVCDKLVDKELLQLALVHRILLCYAEVECDETLKTFVQNRLPIDGVPHLLSSKAGTDSIIRYLSFVTAKQRKEFVRHLKGKWAECAMNNINYVFVMRFFETVDDTVLATKSVTKELIEELPELMKDSCGRKVLAALLTPQDSAIRRHFVAPSEQESLKIPAPTALKNTEIRRKELVKSLLDAMMPLVTTNKLLELAKDVNAKDLIVAYFDNVAEDHPSRAGFVKVVSGVLAEKDIDGTTVSLLSALIKNSESIRDALWTAIVPHLDALLPTRFSLALLAMLKAKPGIRATLLKHKAALKKESGSCAKQLLEELEGTVKGA